MLCAHYILNTYSCTRVCVRVCVRESDVWHISQDELPATPKIKPKTTKTTAETANVLPLRYTETSLAQLSTHTQRHARRISLWLRTRISPAFGTFVDWYIVLGTLVASRCSRFSSSRLLDSCASSYAGRFLERKTRKLNSPFRNRSGFLRLLESWNIYFFSWKTWLFFFTLYAHRV